MATQAPANAKPLFYNELEPISSQLHQQLKIRQVDSAPHLATTHAVPLTVDEFIVAQRDYPIVFSVGDAPVPLALMGLNEGVNVFVGEDGRMTEPRYIPAYVRRYPFMLARLRNDSEELSLCFDPTGNSVGTFDEGQPLFDGDKPTQTLNEVLKFCEDFEIAAQRTNAFTQDLIQSGLLIDGEVAIQPGGAEQPFVYRGFKMIDEEKMRGLDAEQLHRLNDNGALPLMMAHMFSLSLIRDVFGRQMAMGKVPESPPLEAPAPQG
jgi:hypothetical protein